MFEYIKNAKNIDFYRKYIFLSRAKTNIKIKIYENFTLKARSEPHKHLFLMIFHDKNPWRYGSGFSKYISLKIKSLIKCFHKMKKNAIDLKKNRQKINGHRTLSDAGRLRTHRVARGRFSK